jgi:hypothetical protein
VQSKEVRRNKMSREIDKAILIIVKKRAAERICHNGEGTLNDFITAMKNEGYNNTEIAEAILHV